jgi:aspartate racemase
MGPEATVDLMRRIIRATPAQDDRDHIRMLVDNNPQVPSRIKALLEGGGESPLPALTAMARGLERWGADFLAIACNTAHHYLEAIRTAVGIPVLDMIGLTAERILRENPNIRQVGILASTAVLRLDLYGQRLARCGVALIHPGADRQAAVFGTIRAIKAGGFEARHRDILHAAGGELVRRGAQALLIACTELSVVADRLEPAVELYDAAQVLAEAVVAAAVEGTGPEPVRPDR